MKKIACCGYHISGSGVIDDLFREFDNVFQGSYEAESTFLKDPDMVSDLEHHLVENPQRMYSGVAIKRFEKSIKARARNFHHIFGNNWERISFEYAKSLIKIDYQGYTVNDLYLMSSFAWWSRLVRKGLNLVFMPKSKRYKWNHNYFPSAHTYHAVLSESEFLQKTQKYVDNLCDAMSDGTKEYIMLDQLIPPSNPERYMRYVKDLKVVIVDRDPRDIYIQHILSKDHVLPKDPYEFCVVYRDNRVITGNIPDNCMFVKFEDMIYNYEESIEKIIHFVGIDVSHHINKKEHFNPAISIKNTKLWEKHPEFSKDICIIEKELSDYLYKYDI